MWYLMVINCYSEKIIHSFTSYVHCRHDHQCFIVLHVSLLANQDLWFLVMDLVSNAHPCVPSRFRFDWYRKSHPWLTKLKARKSMLLTFVGSAFSMIFFLFPSQIEFQSNLETDFTNQNLWLSRGHTRLHQWWNHRFIKRGKWEFRSAA